MRQESTDDELFERWTASADSDALARLFDAMAPRLLAVAIHLVADVGRAEDLVQSVFMTLIEKRAQINSGTPAEAWLTRVLNHRAVDLRRVRRPDLAGQEALEARAAEPDHSIDRRELEAQVSRAIDELDSPYREVLLARLLHGASAAEIAHLFQRSPGQVRVQLHRGLEMLRSRLPGREALAALLCLNPGLDPAGATSLSAIRDAVLDAASRAPLVSTSAPVGSALLLMSKTKFALATCLAALLLGYGALSIPTAVRQNAMEAGGEVAGEPDDLPDEELLALAIAAPERELAVDQEFAPTSTRRLRGRVIEEASGASVPGAAVRLIRPVASLEGWDELRLTAEFPELVTQSGSLIGAPRAQSGADWPLPKHIKSRLLARPLDPRNQVALETTTGADGDYELDVPAGLWQQALIEVEAAGYGPRIRPLVDRAEADASTRSASTEKLDQGATQADIVLYAPYVFRGQIVDGVHLQPLHESLPVVASFCKLKEGTELPAKGFYDSASIEFMGAWATHSDETGAFELRLFGDPPRLSVEHPAWSAGSVWLEHDPARLAIDPATRFRFVDADSGKPLESVSLTLASKSNGDPHYTGRYLTPDGIFGLYGSEAYLNRSCPMELVAWTDTHAPARLKVDDFDKRREYTLRLQSGSAPTLNVLLTDDGRPVTGREVSLSKDRPKFWDPLQLRRPTATSVTGNDGRAQLGAPAGGYVLAVGSVEHPETTRFVSLPTEGPIELELNQLGTLTATVRVDGELPGDEGTCHVILDGPDGRHSQPEVDAKGQVTFPGLPEGKYTVRPVIFRRAGASFSRREAMREVTVTPGSRMEVQLNLPQQVERQCRFVLQGVDDFTGWEARSNGHSWSPVSAEGTASFRITGDMTWIQVEDGMDRRFKVYAPSGSEPLTVIDLTGGDLQYHGRLANEAGEPLAGVWVQAQPTQARPAEDPMHHAVASLTDREGRFSIESLYAQDYTLTFEDRKERSRTWESRWSSMSFRPNNKPRSVGQGAALEIHLSRLPEAVTVRGQVVDAAGEPCSARVWCRALHQDGGGGTLEVGGKARHSSTGPDGEFEVTLPTGVPCRLRFSAEGAKVGAHTDEVMTLDPGVEPPSLRVVVKR